MSIIGPRPGLWNQDVLTAERDKYGANDVKPGLTGWAQINGRDELEIPEKAKLDGYYVQNMGFKMDGLIQERNINTGETVEFEVSGDKIEAIYMIPGWTHNIINLSETDDLVTVMTCNEIFDPGHPDTFFEPV